MTTSRGNVQYDLQHDRAAHPSKSTGAWSRRSIQTRSLEHRKIIQRLRSLSVPRLRHLAETGYVQVEKRDGNNCYRTSHVWLDTAAQPPGNK